MNRELLNSLNNWWMWWVALGEELPAFVMALQPKLGLSWTTSIARYGAVPDIAIVRLRVLRLGLQFFDRAALPLVPSILARLTARFENTGFASYLWAIGKVIQRFGLEEDGVVRIAIQGTYEDAAKCWAIFAQSAISMHSDGASRALIKFIGC